MKEFKNKLKFGYNSKGNIIRITRVDGKPVKLNESNNVHISFIEICDNGDQISHWFARRGKRVSAYLDEGLKTEF